MRYYRATKVKATKKRQTPFGTRRELAGLIFDLLLHNTPHAEAEQKIRDASKSVTEANAAISRYRMTAGCTKLGGSL